ncbi:hypothetical protein Pcinc_028260 [Petrolisthes cinctipes]|uniref:Uncharacterized protein n=1 Tax=Petrolisthes cinctipes TaxID=88211 RepID=A0AAE1F3H8_PETCI|nr:hypothetical protein Pcinc_028260 [Petrolisthes cinctipes]
MMGSKFVLMMVVYMAPFILQAHGWTCMCTGGECVSGSCHCPEGKSFDSSSNKCKNVENFCDCEDSCPALSMKIITGNGFKCECTDGYAISQDASQCLADSENECLTGSNTCGPVEACCNSPTGCECISWNDVVDKFPNDNGKEPTISSQKLAALQFRLACRVKYHKWLRETYGCNVMYDDCDTPPPGY